MSVCLCRCQAARLEADEACRVRDRLQAGSERMKAELQAKTRQVESQDEVCTVLSTTGNMNSSTYVQVCTP